MTEEEKKLRDEVAMMVLGHYSQATIIGIVSGANQFNDHDFDKLGEMWAEFSYGVADAMLAERNKKA